MRLHFANIRISEKQVITLVILIAAAIAIQCFLAAAGQQYTHYNNYVIFKQSFEHLVKNKNLYVLYPAEHYDLYKYSPAFSLFMGLFYYLPDLAGLLLFNLLNVSVLIIAIQKLQLPKHSLKYLFLFILLELAISLSMTQTNALIAGLIILAFDYLEEDKPFLASFLISLTVFIKLFGIVAFVLWFLYPQKLKFLLYSIFWCLVLAIIPVIVVSKNSLISQYHNWLILLKNDFDASYGISFMGWMHMWFKINLPKTQAVAVAAIVFCLPLLKFRTYKLYFFRVQILASILLWIVIFNHKAENPSYIIALCGVAIWYFSQKPNSVNKTLLWLCVIFTSFSSTDLITPGWIENKYIEPYAVKAVFCCIIWFKLVIDLVTQKFTPAVIDVSPSPEGRRERSPK
jgi:hypothetical protein